MPEGTPKIEESWLEALKEDFDSPYFVELKEFLKEEMKAYKIYPPGSQIFSAFNFTPLTAVRVVIIGQDPYHGPGQAHGLCFSVPDGIKKPPSLVIFTRSSILTLTSTSLIPVISKSGQTRVCFC